ncbi:hypothetical protein [Desulfovibrio sp. An276]|uniref:hypothetical protein n=1 Tax=Desulfovibrio sp. An276 TaxID=1965618 RepID=UPI001184E315|nr:hypothetical protein [Desulfovibrio sp. An276]
MLSEELGGKQGRQQQDKYFLSGLDKFFFMLISSCAGRWGLKQIVSLMQAPAASEKLREKTENTLLFFRKEKTEIRQKSTQYCH